MKALLNTSTFLEMGILPSCVLFFSYRLTLYALRAFPLFGSCSSVLAFLGIDVTSEELFTDVINAFIQGTVKVFGNVLLTDI